MRAQGVQAIPYQLVQGVSLSCSVDTLSDSIKKMLQYFDVLLRGELRLEYAQLFVKIMVINIFSIHHASDEHVGECNGCLHSACLPAILCLLLIRLFFVCIVLCFVLN